MRKSWPLRQGPSSELPVLFWPYSPGRYLKGSDLQPHDSWVAVVGGWEEGAFVSPMGEQP